MACGDLNTLLRSLEPLVSSVNSDLYAGTRKSSSPDELSQAFTALLAVAVSAMYGIDSAVVVAAANRIGGHIAVGGCGTGRRS